MSISSLNSRISQLKSERSKLESRKSSVSKIIKKIGQGPSDDVSNIKKYAKSTADSLAKGILGSPAVNRVAETSQVKATSGCSLDHWEEKDSLNQEVRRIETRIGEINREIKTLETQLQAEKQAELAAKIKTLKNAIF